MSVAGLKRTIRRGLGLAAPAVWRFRPTNSLVILTYHRVLPKDHPDRLIEQPGMYVSPETLAMHLRVLKEHFEIVDLSEWIARRRDGKLLPVRGCSITFDDGWRDNYEFAFPILKQADVPATIFLVSDFIGTRYSFWPNRLARLLNTIDGLSSAHLPNRLREVLQRAGDPIATYGASVTADQIDTAIEACKALPDAAMVELLDQVADRMPGTVSVGARDLLDAREIMEMRDAGLVKFGSHTRRHTRLTASLPVDALKNEIEVSRKNLEQLLGQPVSIFCYPNGDYTGAAVEIVRQTYRGAVTTGPGWNRPDGDPCLLRRVAIHEGIATDPLSCLARITSLA